MIKHLQIRVHITCIPLIDKTIVVSGYDNFLPQIHDNKDIGIYIFGFNFLNL